MATNPVPLARDIERDRAHCLLTVQVEARKDIDEGLDKVGHYLSDGDTSNQTYQKTLNITLDRLFPILERYTRAGWYCAWAYMNSEYEKRPGTVNTARVYFWIRPTPIPDKVLQTIHRLPDPPAHTLTT